MDEGAYILDTKYLFLLSSLDYKRTIYCFS